MANLSRLSAFSASFLCIASVFVAREARALGPLDLEVAAKAGFGTKPGDQPLNPLKLGLGARAGVTFLGLYGGLSIIDYFGESSSDGTISDHALMYGAEAGYGTKLLDVLTLRAQLGVGNFAETVDLKPGAIVAGSGVVTAAASATSNSIYLEPALLGMITVGSFLIGADAGVLVLPSRAVGDGKTELDAAFTVHAQLGVKF
jgi:hypothetical protein